MESYKKWLTSVAPSAAAALAAYSFVLWHHTTLITFQILYIRLINNMFTEIRWAACCFAHCNVVIIIIIVTIIIIIFSIYLSHLHWEVNLFVFILQPILNKKKNIWYNTTINHQQLRLNFMWCKSNGNGPPLFTALI